MTVRSFKVKRGFTMGETLIAVTVLVIALIGTSAYNYHSALRTRRSVLYENGIRMAILLCEDWSGVGGAQAFNPVATFGSDLDITADSGPACLEDFNLLGSYKIVVEGFNYYVTLSWKDIGSDMRALNIAVAWNHSGCGTGTFADTNKTYQLMSYVQQ